MPVVRTDGLSVYGHVITKFSWMGRLLYFPTHDASLVRFMRESSALILYQAQEQLIRMRLLFIQCSPMIQATRLLLKNLLFFIGTYHICITPENKIFAQSSHQRMYCTHFTEINSYFKKGCQKKCAWDNRKRQYGI